MYELTIHHNKVACTYNSYRILIAISTGTYHYIEQNTIQKRVVSQGRWLGSVVRMLRYCLGYG